MYIELLEGSNNLHKHDCFPALSPCYEVRYRRVTVFDFGTRLKNNTQKKTVHEKERAHFPNVEYSSNEGSK